jgi:hypothetical protein
MEYDYLVHRIGDSRPTQFDRSVASVSREPQFNSWFVVAFRSRDSKALEVSNFECALAILAPFNDDAKVLSFGHWACGWYETLVVNPDNKEACKEADDILRALADYPVIDDEHHSAKECEMEECECTCCVKDWCDCELCVAARRDDDYYDDADIVLDEEDE